MEKKVRKKRTQSALSNKEGKDAGAGAGKTRTTAEPGKKTSAAKKASPAAGPYVLNMRLTPATAKQAVVLSEIIGKPVSKRRK